MREHQYILRSFTQFETRIYEQALISYYLPKLNGGKIVVFPFMNWESHIIQISLGKIDVPITAVAKDGSFSSFF